MAIKRIKKKKKQEENIKLIPGYSSPRWSCEITDCSMPMTFDQYGKCFYKCFYCFAAYQKAIGIAKANYTDSHIVKAVKVDKVKRIFTEDWPGNQFWDYIKDRKTIQWGGMADPFCPYEKKFGVGLELLRFFKDINYPICFSTKGTWWVDDPRYAELFKGQKNWNVKFSIITNDDKKARICEGGVPSSTERLKALEKVASWDCGGATLRLRPFIIGISNPGHQELIRRAGEAGATALSTEFFCMEQRSNTLRDSLPKINKLIGFNMFKFYKKYSYQQGYMRLNRNVKRQFVNEMEDACRKAGMRFYVSDAHFKERCDNGSCCGLPSDWNYARGQWTEALQIAKKKGKVRWRDMEKHLKYAERFLYRKADGLNTSGSDHRARFHNFTMKEYLRWIWNHPKNGQSPYTMYEGILVPTGLDENDNIIYKYNKEKE